MDNHGSEDVKMLTTSTTAAEAVAVTGQDTTKELGSTALLSNIHKRPIMEQPNSPLLRLPAELRNRIYRYALTTEETLDFIPASDMRLLSGDIPEKSILSARQSPCEQLWDEFNQIKYVCRQLYTETACLEFRSNTLRFRGCHVPPYGGDHPAQNFLEFLEFCAPSKASWLSRVDLWMDATDWFYSEQSELYFESSLHLKLVADFCRVHSLCKVRYIFDLFSTNFLTAEKFIREGMLMELHIRHNDLFVRPSNEETYKIEDAVYWASSRRIKSLEVPNLRFFPNPYSRIDEKFRQAIMRLPQTIGITERVLKERVKLAESWIENGI